MRNQKFIALVAAAVSAIMSISAASAADLPVKAPLIAPPAFTWTGFYFGLNGGYGWNSTTGDQFCITPAPASIIGGLGCSVSEPGTLKPKGWLFGGQLGYNYQVGMFVWGIEGDIQGAQIKNTNTLNLPCCLPSLLTPGTLTTTQELSWFGTVRGRLGIAWNRALLYGTGGVIFGQENRSTLVVFPAVSYPALGSTTRGGWVAGAGLEYAFTNNFTAKIEGLYYDMGSQTIGFTSPLTNFTEGGTFNFKGSLIRVGANWKFGP